MKIVKPARLLDFGWSFPTNIITASSEKLPLTYLDECIGEAQRRNVLVYLIDFSYHKNLPDVLATKQAQLAMRAIVSTDEQTLIILKDADLLAPLECAFTYSLRTAIETNVRDPLMYILTARKASLRDMFSNVKAPFFNSNYAIV